MSISPLLTRWRARLFLFFFFSRASWFPRLVLFYAAERSSTASSPLKEVRFRAISLFYFRLDLFFFFAAPFFARPWFIFRGRLCLGSFLDVGRFGGFGLIAFTWRSRPERRTEFLPRFDPLFLLVWRVLFRVCIRSPLLHLALTV